MESLLVRVTPLTPRHTVNDVSELLLQQDYRRFLCLPVVDQGQPVGTVSRDELQTIFMKMYGRELHGRKPVVTVMNPKPLVVDIEQPLDRISQYIADNVRFPITEDFIITRENQYLGVGHVVDLLRSMQARLDHRNRELAKAYDRLKSSQTQLVQSEKMASLGQMVAGVAHEINTPLGYVKNNINLARDALSLMQTRLIAYESLLARLMSGEADEIELEAGLASIREMREEFESGFTREDVENLFDDTLYGVEQISEIVLNLRDFSRLDQAPVDNVNLNQCLDSALLIARNVLKHKAEIIKDYGNTPPVTCAPSQINQIFLNLLTNAAHAIDDKGRILVKTYSDERYVHAIVQDTGKGIPQENLKHIFDPFFTTKPIGQGTGLGLSIAYQIVRRHGGHIRVASQVGLGTKFCVSLPHRLKLN
ncbi:MAG: ATP-binding protein [Pseudomonadota bacterium]